MNGINPKELAPDPSLPSSNVFTPKPSISTNLYKIIKKLPSIPENKEWQPSAKEKKNEKSK